MFEHADDQSRLLRSEDVLTTEYTPAEPVGRKEELDRIADAVRPLIHRKQPENLLVYGPTGTGKSLVTDHIMENLQEQTRVTTVTINCWQYNTRSSLLTELLIQLGYPAPRKGKPIDALLARLTEWVSKHDGVLITLDEFDQHTDQAAIAYDLHALGTTPDHPVGTILISNQSPIKLELDARSHSRLAYHPLEFSPYTEEDLCAILTERAADAFHAGTVTDAALETIASTVSAQSGDCRDALTLLRRAARHAEQAGADTLDADCITERKYQ